MESHFTQCLHVCVTTLCISASHFQLLAQYNDAVMRQMGGFMGLRGPAAMLDGDGGSRCAATLLNAPAPTPPLFSFLFIVFLISVPCGGKVSFVVSSSFHPIFLHIYSVAKLLVWICCSYSSQNSLAF